MSEWNSRMCQIYSMKKGYGKKNWSSLLLIVITVVDGWHIEGLDELSESKTNVSSVIFEESVSINFSLNIVGVWFFQKRETNYRENFFRSKGSVLRTVKYLTGKPEWLGWKIPFTKWLRTVKFWREK